MSLKVLLIFNAIFTVALVLGVILGVVVGNIIFISVAVFLLLIDNLCVTHTLVKLCTKVGSLSTLDRLSTELTEMTRNASYMDEKGGFNA